MKTMRLHQRSALSFAVTIVFIISITIQTVVFALPVTKPNRSSNRNKTVLLKSTEKDDEFSVLMPAEPTPLITRFKMPFKNGASIDEERTFAVYAQGAVLMARMSKTSNPKKTLEAVIDVLTHDEKRATIVSILDITRGGIKGKQIDSYDVAPLYKEKFFKRTQLFPTKTQLYSVSVSVRDEHHQIIDQFFSTLRLGDEVYAAAAGSPYEVVDDKEGNTSSGQIEQVFKPEEVTRKAVLVWTPVAPFMRVPHDSPFSTGSIILQMVLTSAGQITDIKVIKGQTQAMNERVIEAVKYYKFIPAEKDGRPVSQLHTFEYEFNH